MTVEAFWSIAYQPHALLLIPFVSFIRIELVYSFICLCVSILSFIRIIYFFCLFVFVYSYQLSNYEWFYLYAARHGPWSQRIADLSIWNGISEHHCRCKAVRPNPKWSSENDIAYKHNSNMHYQSPMTQVVWVCGPQTCAYRLDFSYHEADLQRNGATRGHRPTSGNSITQSVRKAKLAEVSQRESEDPMRMTTISKVNQGLQHQTVSVREIKIILFSILICIECNFSLDSKSCLGLEQLR